MIKTEKLYFSYNGSAPFILDGIDIEIKRGEYVSMMGENGCGKTTLIKLILGFLKPTRGAIFSEAKSVGYVPQKQDRINSGFPITVYEMLNSYRGLLKIRDKNQISENLALVGLEDKESSLMGTLSGGQFQKALIARALMGNPELIVLDEPSSGVDIDSQKEIYRLLKKLNTELGITVISVEHNLEAAVSNSTLIYHLSKGKGHFCNPQNYAEEYLNSRR